MKNDQNHQGPCVLKIRQLMYITSVIITILLLWTIYLLFWTDKTFAHWILYHGGVSSSPILHQLNVIQKSSRGHVALQLPRTMELQRQQSTQSIKKVKGTRTLLVSAYLEHRTDEKQVRVIAVVLRSENVAYRCLFRCQEKQLLSNGVADIHTDHFGFAYGTADIMCPLPSGCEIPSSIAVTSADANSTSLLEVIPWSLSRYVNVSRGWLPEHGPGELHYFGQIPALNDCLYRYMYQSRYVALHDIDELILPQKVISWVELLPLLENKYGANKCYMFENNVFPINITLAPPASQSLPPQTDWKNVTGVNILAHLYQEPIIEETHYTNFKIIVNPRAVFSTSVHGILKSQHGCSWIDRSIARMYHTRFQKQPNLTEDKLIYDGRLLSYSTHFTPAVNKVLRETGFLPEHSTQ